MTIYISGRITGDANYKEKFNRAEKLLFSIGNDPVNPAKVELGKKATWADYMKHDLHALLCSDAIYMLKGWRRSKGARLERYIAKKLGLKIIYEGAKNVL